MAKNMLEKVLLIALCAVAPFGISEGKMKFRKYFDVGTGAVHYSINGLSKKLQTIPNPSSQGETIVDLQHGFSGNMGIRAYGGIDSKNLSLNLGLEQNLNLTKGAYDAVKESSPTLPDSECSFVYSFVRQDYSITPFVLMRLFNESFGIEAGLTKPFSKFTFQAGYKEPEEKPKKIREKSWKGSSKDFGFSIGIDCNLFEGLDDNDPWIGLRYNQESYSTSFGKITIRNFELFTKANF